MPGMRSTNASTICAMVPSRRSTPLCTRLGTTEGRLSTWASRDLSDMTTLLLSAASVRRWLAFAGGFVAALFAVSQPFAAVTAPTLRVENIRRAFHNGEHNAFTDLTRWRGQFWLTFRSSPDGHGVFASGSVVILTSADAKSWRQAHRFSVADRDTRDPHFLIFKDRL